MRLVDTLVTRYGFDDARVYSEGFSNGGFMSYRLACERPERFAAVGSVAGGFAPGRRALCTPGAMTPVLQVQGTRDAVIPREGSGFNEAIDSTVAFWARLGGCRAVDTSAVPDRDPGDGLRTVRYAYRDCEAGPGDTTALVEYLVVEGGEHRWPGSPFGSPGTTADFAAAEELWRFFAQFPRPPVDTAAVDTTGVDTTGGTSALGGAGFGERPPAAYPNPVGPDRRLRLPAVDRPRAYALRGAAGAHVAELPLAAGAETLALPAGLPPGTYVLREVGSVGPGLALVLR